MIDARGIQTGCYVEGWWGQYAGAHMVDRAAEFGYCDDEAISLARKHLNAMQPSDAPALTDGEHDALHDAVDDAESWLNENVAENGYLFGWHDGEFFYQPLTWWDEAY